MQILPPSCTLGLSYVWNVIHACCVSCPLSLQMYLLTFGWMLQVAEGQQRLMKLAEEAAGAPVPSHPL